MFAQRIWRPSRSAALRLAATAIVISMSVATFAQQPEVAATTQTNSVPVGYLETRVQLLKLQNRYQAGCRRQGGRVCLGAACGEAAPESPATLLRLDCDALGARLTDPASSDPPVNACESDGWGNRLRSYAIHWSEGLEVLLLWSAGEDGLFSLATAVGAPPDDGDYDADRIVRVGCRLPQS